MILDRLALAAEFRDDNTGHHTERVGQMAALIAVIAGGAFFLLSNKEDIPLVNKVFDEPECQLTGEEPRKDSLIEKPAVGVKIDWTRLSHPGFVADVPVHSPPSERRMTAEPSIVARTVCTRSFVTSLVRSRGWSSSWPG